jgi:hypothetical protein
MAGRGLQTRWPILTPWRTRLIVFHLRLSRSSVAPRGSEGKRSPWDSTDSDCTQSEGCRQRRLAGQLGEGARSLCGLRFGDRDCTSCDWLMSVVDHGGSASRYGLHQR